MKKFFIVHSNMEIGGAETSLLGLLKSIDYDKYKVDLLLLNPVGELMNMIPKQVRILSEYSEYRNLLLPIKEVIKNKNIKWLEDSFGIITLEITRNCLFDKIAQKTFKVPPKSYIKLDKHGSFVWKCIDDNK